MIEVLSDTQGVDFRPYLQDILSKVRKTWYDAIPESSSLKKGKVSIELAIFKNGSVSGMTLVKSSGDIPLDRAAWAGIINSAPFSSLPSDFAGEYLALRFHFYYNPNSADLAQPDSATNHPAKSDSSGSLDNRTRVDHMAPPMLLTDTLAKSAAPEYPKEAVTNGTEGFVVLDIDIDANGVVGTVGLERGDPLLAAAARRAIKNWQFYPAQHDGLAVGGHVRIGVNFRLSDRSVTSQVMFPESSLAK